MRTGPAHIRDVCGWGVESEAMLGLGWGSGRDWKHRRSPAAGKGSISCQRNDQELSPGGKWTAGTNGCPWLRSSPQRQRNPEDHTETSTWVRLPSLKVSSSPPAKKRRGRNPQDWYRSFTQGRHFGVTEKDYVSSNGKVKFPGRAPLPLARPRQTCSQNCERK